MQIYLPQATSRIELNMIILVFASLVAAMVSQATMGIIVPQALSAHQEAMFAFLLTKLDVKLEINIEAVGCAQQ